MMHHELKIEEPYYEQIISGGKNFEIRFNDRGYQKGDTIRLIVPFRSLPAVDARIGYVTAFMQRDGWVVFSLIEIATEGLER